VLRRSIRAVLFDFDGTLADTAADLGAAVNRLRSARGLAALPAADYRPYASGGARALLKAGFGMTPEDERFPAMREAFLAEYERNPCAETKLFAGMPELLESLATRQVAWGIVTNKSQRFTATIVAALGIAPACVVCGDTTPHLKPHPAPLLRAAELLGLNPDQCLYVGDDLRDIQAARAAGMPVAAVEWGYHGVDAGPHTWQADAVIARPEDLIRLL
jgi:2-phosphoglycolate phosphatase